MAKRSFCESATKAIKRIPDSPLKLRIFKIPRRYRISIASYSLASSVMTNGRTSLNRPTSCCSPHVWIRFQTLP